MDCIEQEVAPSSTTEVSAAMQQYAHERRPVYFIGGGTSLDYGWLPTEPGIGMKLAGMNEIVEYNPRDMTIVAQAGVTFAQLSEALAGENQHLPIDVPQEDQATLGGMAATNWSGPRRAGRGTLRDYVIGITAVDGRGMEYKGGGKVVKNVAGYDFCKMLIGSMGALGPITSMTLRVDPLPECSQTLVVASDDLASLDAMLADLTDAPASPMAVDLIRGPRWGETLATLGISPGETPSALVFRAEGMSAEVEALMRHIEALGQRYRGGSSVRVDGDDQRHLFSQQVRFVRDALEERPDGDRVESPLAIKAAVRPSMALQVLEMLEAHDQAVSTQLHAANGIIHAHFSTFDAEDLTAKLISEWRPAAIQRGGSMVVLESQYTPLSHQVVWGPGPSASRIMNRMIEAFDPAGICNPGRLVPAQPSASSR